ncbi:944_t:CDS:2 [Ambispora gerdemannii]|uniref:944_t:CDS:1 n=1 Tax=Ambispora gerdemannii TaxID=144530 RepID=A0A9N9BJ48_9GLOM|nr:944_t:CDS:2 [Ambispora gerdemannii]
MKKSEKNYQLKLARLTDKHKIVTLRNASDQVLDFQSKLTEEVNKESLSEARSAKLEESTNSKKATDKNDIRYYLSNKQETTESAGTLTNSLKRKSELGYNITEIEIKADDEKISIEKQKFLEMRKRNIYPLCKPFRELSKEDAEGLFDEISSNTNIVVELPNNLKEYLKELFSGNIENAMSKIEIPLRNPNNLSNWTREVCRHFLLYFNYGGLQIEGDEKTWSTQTVYRMLDLFSMFFRKIISGVSFGEIINEAQNDRKYNINYTQKPSQSGCASKNDGVMYQEEVSTLIYEQSFGPTEFTDLHHLNDIVKLSRNGVDDLNFHFTKNSNCDVTTAKKLKSISVHGYKYFLSIYVTDLIRVETYRMYEIFSCKIPISYSERWELFNIAKFGALLEKLLTERQGVKEEMCREQVLNDDKAHSVQRWIKIPDNSPPKVKRNK